MLDPTPSATSDKNNSLNKPCCSSSFLRNLAVIGGLSLTPHAFCILAGLGLASLGGYSIQSFCGHAEKPSERSFDIEINRLPTIPRNYKHFPETTSIGAREILLEAQPKFKEIIAAKQLESPESEIQVTFIETPDLGACVVICKDGALCPCSLPQIYELGKSPSVSVSKELYAGQKKILQALYRDR